MKEITKILINSGIAALLVFSGSAASELQDHGFSDFRELGLGLCLGFIAGLIVFLTKMQGYMAGKKGSTQLLNFI